MPCLAVVRASPVPWVRSACRGVLAGPLGSVWHRVGLPGILGWVWLP